MRPALWTRALTVAVCAVIAGGGTTATATAADSPGPSPSPSASSAGPADPSGSSASTGATGASARPDERSKGVSDDDIRLARETERYWTPERIRAAVPVDDAASTPAPGERRKRALRAPSAPVDQGVATVGVFLIRAGDGSATADQFCTAGSVASPTKSLVLTAAHCLKGDKPYRSVAFVPGYRAGATKAGQPGETPYGIFPMLPGQVWIDGRYLQSKPDDDVDFALLRVGPNAQGQLLEDATGRGNELTAVPASQLARDNVTVVGYPGGQKTPLQCTNSTKAFQGRFLEIECAGFRSGVSGGPFLTDFDGRRGKLIGAIGGYKTGGRYDHISYSSQFDEDVLRLYRQAVDGARPDTPSPLGDATTWQHTKVMAAGRFHSSSVRDGNSDLIVGWTDGEVTLYPGDGAHGFGKGIRLANPHSTWTHVSFMTAGDFTGSGTNDLVVRWSDGELTLYEDVDETNKLGKEIRLRPRGSFWTRAHGIAAGRFGGGDQRADDLLVRWSDGHVSVYTNVDGKGLHAEKRLIGPNKTWTYARDIAAGDFTASSAGQDLFVRWADGEVSVFEDAAGTQLKKERRLRAPKSPWRNVAMATVGAFGGDGRADDVVARWPDGKLTLNPDSRAGALGPERTLIPKPGS
ncbi:trypsin-like serine peptidase [Streptomyces sp. NPDC048595]|uniref:trypsin-like serine peptidase n=1 Tax=Streptomyces sp. NPDC048595 TaxID=3365576 RepID=UPI0037174D27